jgi:hypothetical protein
VGLGAKGGPRSPAPCRHADPSRRTRSIRRRRKKGEKVATGARGRDKLHAAGSRAGPTHIPKGKVAARPTARQRRLPAPLSCRAPVGPRLDLFSVWAPLTATGRARAEATSKGIPCGRAEQVACVRGRSPFDTWPRRGRGNGVNGWARRGSVGVVGTRGRPRPERAGWRHDAWGRQRRGVPCQ